MLQYKEFAFIAVPVCCDERDMEFNIFSIDGTLLGNSVSGLANADFSPELREELEDYLHEQLLIKEAKIKFLKEFGCPVEKASRTGYVAVELLDIMYSKWRIRCDILDRLIA